MTGCAMLQGPIETGEAMGEFYEQPLPIRTYDIDFAGIVSNIVFIRWLEDLRLGLMEEAYPLIRALAEDVAPILLATRLSPAGDDPRPARWPHAGRPTEPGALAPHRRIRRRRCHPCRGRAGGAVHAPVDAAADRDPRADPPLARRMTLLLPPMALALAEAEAAAGCGEGPV